jgi:ABC-type Fe3+-hydroxamate transport system substrate-binding protein
MITQIGAMTGKERNALSLITRIKKNFSGLPVIQSAPPAAYLIWQHPYMTTGSDTFIHSMLTAAGFKNIFSDRTRYPEITIDELARANCQVLFLSSEPFPFRQKHIDELQPQLPGTRIVLVDGEMFSWYGSRMQYAPGYFGKLREKVEGIGN